MKDLVEKVKAELEPLRGFQRIKQISKATGHPVHLYGGFIRAIALGGKPKDVDLVSTAEGHREIRRGLLMQEGDRSELVEKGLKAYRSKNAFGGDKFEMKGMEFDF